MPIGNLSATTPTKTKMSKSSKTRLKSRIEIRKEIMRNHATEKFSSSDVKINATHSRKYKFCGSTNRVGKEKAIAISRLNCKSNQLNMFLKVTIFQVLTI